MELFGHDYSSTTLAVRWLCHELNIDIDYVCVGPRDVEEYIPDQIKSDCRIPMISDRGWVLSDSNTILRYLATEVWFPAERQKRAIVDQWLGWQSSRLGPKAAEYVAVQFFAANKAPASAELMCWLDVLLSELDNALEQQPFVAGTQISIADLSIATSLWYLELGAFPFQTLNNVRPWFERLKSRPGFQLAMPELP